MVFRDFRPFLTFLWFSSKPGILLRGLSRQLLNRNKFLNYFTAMYQLIYQITQNDQKQQFCRKSSKNSVFHKNVKIVTFQLILPLKSLIFLDSQVQMASFHSQMSPKSSKIVPKWTKRSLKLQPSLLKLPSTESRALIMAPNTASQTVNSLWFSVYEFYL